MKQKPWFDSWRVLALLLAAVLAFRIWWLRDVMVSGDDAGNYLTTMHWLFQDGVDSVYNFRPPLVGLIVAPFYYLAGLHGLKALALVSSLVIAIPVFMLTRNAIFAALALFLPLMEQPLLWGFMLYYSLALFFLILYFKDRPKIAAVCWFLLAGFQQTGFAFALGIFAVIALAHKKASYILPSLAGIVWLLFYFGRPDTTAATLFDFSIPWRQGLYALGLTLTALYMIFHLLKKEDLKTWAPVICLSLFTSLLFFKSITLETIVVRAPYYLVLGIFFAGGVLVKGRGRVWPILIATAAVAFIFVQFTYGFYRSGPGFYKTLTPDVVAVSDWLKDQPFKDKDMLVVYPSGTAWWVEGLTGRHVWVTDQVNTVVFESQYANMVIEGLAEWNGYVIVDSKPRDIDYARTIPTPNWEALNPYLVQEFGTVRVFEK